MVSAPAGASVGALVDRLAGVMAVNSLSAEAVLAGFFSQDIMASHLVKELGKSGKGNPATLAARIVAQWKPGAKAKQPLGKRKTRGEQAAAAAAAAAAALEAAPVPSEKGGTHAPAASDAASQLLSTGLGPKTAAGGAEPKRARKLSGSTAGKANAGVQGGVGVEARGRGPPTSGRAAEPSRTPHDPPLRLSETPVETTVPSAHASCGDVTADGGVWSSSHDQYQMMTVNWTMRVKHPEYMYPRSFNFRDEFFYIRTRYSGVVGQRPRDHYQLTPQGLMYKVERGGCPLCCGDEVFLLTLQVRELINPETGKLVHPRMPGEPSRVLPDHRVLMENWVECHCSGVTTKVDPEVDVGYVADGSVPRDSAAHLVPAAKARVVR